MYNEAISAWALQGFLLCSDATGLVGQDPPGGGGEMGQTDFYATISRGSWWKKISGGSWWKINPNYEVATS